MLFGGIIVGHFAQTYDVVLNGDMLHFIQEFGLILFVYTIGIQVGPGFFSSLRVSGLRLNCFAILMVVVGGPGYFLGPLLGSAVGVILPEWLRFAQAWYLFVFGAAVVVLMIWLPDGLLSIPDRIKAKRQAREASAARAAAAQQQGAQ